MYIDYESYAMLGGSADYAAFHRLQFKAEKALDRYTQGRVSKMETVPHAVKMCLVELIDAIGKAEFNPVAPAVKSYSNDGYSETYDTPMTAETMEHAIYWIICDCLAGETDDTGTPLLYLGVS